VTYVLGVDAGNTKTVALVARRDGTVAGAGRAGCGDIYGLVYHDTKGEEALANVVVAVTEALRVAGIGPEHLAAGGFNMAGADWPEDYAFLRARMEEYGFGQAVVVVNDAMGALRAGSPDGRGVVVVCGSGIAIGGRASDGRVWHGSFWLEGGGSQRLGQQALRAVYHAALGLDAPTALTARVLEIYERETPAEVLQLFTARLGTPPRDVGNVAAALLDEAERGDAAACRIVRENGALCGDYAVVAARRVGIERDRFPLVLTGGVLRHPSPLLGDAITVRVRAACPGAYPVYSGFEPVVGALLMALEAAGVAPDAPLRDRLAATLPPSSLFRTFAERNDAPLC
jgi:N-acetylglucosamine kinase-like BadF-type ATPase